MFSVQHSLLGAALLKPLHYILSSWKHFWPTFFFFYTSIKLLCFTFTKNKEQHCTGPTETCPKVHAAVHNIQDGAVGTERSFSWLHSGFCPGLKPGRPDRPSSDTWQLCHWMWFQVDGRLTGEVTNQRKEGMGIRSIDQSKHGTAVKSLDHSQKK